MLSGNLPDGWETKTLEDICIPPQYGWTTSGVADGQLKLLRTTDITSGQIDWDTVPFCAEEPPNKEKYLLHDGDIVISRAGSVGFSQLIKNPKPSVFASYLIRFRPLTNEKYMAFFLQSPSYWEAISEQSLGIAVPNVNASKLKQIEIPIAPEPEQERIVAKIEELFTQLDAGTAALKRVQAGLKRYKASVLKAAVEGRLLESGRPNEWKWVTIEQACERIVDCLHSTPNFSEKGNFCVDSTWIKPGVFVFEKARFVDDETFIERNRRMKPQANDVVFSREGALLGVAVQIPENFEFCLGQRMMIFRPEKSLNSRFLEFFLNSQVFRSQFAPLITGTASPHLNIGDIRSFRIPLPPLTEQLRIVAEVERRLSVAAQVEATLAASMARASRLRQSVLKSAFEGRLA